MGSRVTTSLAAAALLAALSSCGIGTSEVSEQTACQSAFADASAVTDVQATPDDLRPAFDACGDLQEFVDGAATYPSVLGDVDSEQFATEQCQAGDAELGASPVCASIGA